MRCRRLVLRPSSVLPCTVRIGRLRTSDKTARERLPALESIGLRSELRRGSRISSKLLLTAKKNCQPAASCPKPAAPSSKRPAKSAGRYCLLYFGSVQQAARPNGSRLAVFLLQFRGKNHKKQRCQLNVDNSLDTRCTFFRSKSSLPMVRID